MTAESDQTDNTIGFLFPDEIVEKCGLKEGDIFDAISVEGGHPVAAGQS